MIYCPLLTHRFTDQTMRERTPGPEQRIDQLEPMLLPSHCLHHTIPASYFIDREVFLRIGGYDARYEGAEDLQLIHKLIECGAAVQKFSKPKQSYFLASDTGSGFLYLAVPRLRLTEELKLFDEPRMPAADREHIISTTRENLLHLLSLVSWKAHHYQQATPIKDAEMLQRIKSVFLQVLDLLRLSGCRRWMLLSVIRMCRR